MGAAMPVLEVRGLEKSFGGLRVTRDVSLTVPAGEMHALIGPNGAGKTTLIAQLCGELAPSRGAVLLHGRDITRAPVHARARLGMGRSFQITTLVRELTVADNIALALIAQDGHAFRFWRDHRADRDLRAAAEAALSRVGLAARAAEPVSDLSHGEQRFLELAMALAGEPSLLLLDEPMAGLGAEESHVMTAFLAGLKGTVTVLLVEHDMDAVFRLADRITVLVRGEAIAVGTVDEIRRDPTVREAYLGEDASCCA